MIRALASRRRSGLVAVGWVLIAALGTASAADAPGRSPSRLLSRKGLVAYLEYDGLDAHAAAWKATAAGGIFNDTPAGSMLAELARQLLDRVLKEEPGMKVSAADLLGLPDDLVRQGFALAAYDHGDGASSIALVFNGLGRKGPRGRFDRLLRGLDAAQGEDAPARPDAPRKLRGRDVYPGLDKAPLRVKNYDDDEPLDAPEGDPKPAPKVDEAPSVSWWFEGDDLVLIVGPSASGEEPKPDGEQPGKRPKTHADELNSVFDAIEGKVPNASSHAAYLDALAEGKDVGGFEPDGLFFIEVGGKKGLLASLTGGDSAANPLDVSNLVGVLTQLQGANPLSALLSRTSTVAEELQAPIPPEPVGPPDGPVLPAPPDHATPASAPATLPPTEEPVPASALRYAPPGAAPAPVAPAYPGNAAPALAPATERPVAAPALRYAPPGAAPAPVAPAQPGNAAPALAPEPVPGNVAPALGPPPAPGEAIPGPALPDDPPGVAPSAVTPVQPPDDPTPYGSPLALLEKVIAGKPRPGVDELEVLGLKGVTRIVGRWGFQGKGLVTDVRFETPAPHKGVIGLFAQPTFRKDRLPPIPDGTRDFVVGSFDPGKSYDRAVRLLKEIEPELKEEIEKVEKAVSDATGLKLRQDLLAHLGPSWCVYELPGEGRDEAYNSVVVAGVNDPEAFGKTLDALADRINGYLREIENGGDEKKAADPPVLALVRLAALERGYRLTSPARLVPWLGEGISPTLLVGKSYVAFAVNPAKARAALAPEARPGVWKPEGELARSFAGLPEALTSLSVGDPGGCTLPDLLASLPAYVQVWSNLMLFSGGEGAAPATMFHSVLGIPAPGGFRLRIAPEKIPTPEQVRARLFPSVLATVVDDRGFRWIGREAFPFAGVPGTESMKLSQSWNLSKPADSRLKLNLDLLHLLGR